MFIGTTLPFVQTFVTEVDTALRRIQPEAGADQTPTRMVGVLSAGHSGHQLGVLETF